MAALSQEILITHSGTESVRKLPVNFDHSDAELFAAEFVRKIHAGHMLKLHDVYLIEDDIFDARRMSFFRSYTHPNAERPLAGFIKKKLLPFMNLRKLTGTKCYVGKALWITDNWSNSYFHWMTDALPRLQASRPIMNGHIVMLPYRLKKFPFVAQSLKELQIPFSFFGPDYIVKVSELLLPAHTADRGNYHPHLINDLRSSFLKEIPVKVDRRIFISRKKAKVRTISNESQVEDVLKKFNFETHCFEDYPLKKQIEVMSGAQAVVGMHGAGLTNMLFMQKDAQVLELRVADDKHNNCYFTLASELDLQYFYMLTEKVGNQKYANEVTVEINKLTDVLNQMLNSRLIIR